MIVPQLILFATVPSEAQVREMEKVAEEFLRAYPLEELGDNVRFSIGPNPGSRSTYVISVIECY